MTNKAYTISRRVSCSEHVGLGRFGTDRDGPGGHRATARREAVQRPGKTDRGERTGAATWGATGSKPTWRCPIGLTLKHASTVGDRIFIDGNSAAALRSGVRRRDGLRLVSDYAVVVVAEAFSRYCYGCGWIRRRQEQFAIVQAEDELASIGMVIGAAWNGARAFTATSGPGISLMQEFVGLAYFAEIPAVIFDVQRAARPPACQRARSRPTSPSARMPRMATPNTLLLLPEDPYECSPSRLAFDLADRLQTPISSCSIWRSV